VLLAALVSLGSGAGASADPGPACARIVELNAVYFGTQTWGLNRPARNRLAENVEVLERCPALCVEVVGYADGREPRPEQISARRAEVVEAYYREHGVAEGRVRVRSGDIAPDDAYRDDLGASSRRVESVPQVCR